MLFVMYIFKMDIQKSGRKEAENRMMPALCMRRRSSMDLKGEGRCVFLVYGKYTPFTECDF